jgi:hypothetical protein
MTPRLPALARLAADLRAVSWDRNQTVADSISYLAGHSGDLAGYSSPEDLGLAAYGDEPDRAALALSTHLDAVRNVIVEQLWRREIFIGSEVIDQLLFYAAKHPGHADPLMATLTFLRNRRATRPGLILFPLHSLGILRAGLLRGDIKERAQFIHPDWGTALTPQTNAIRQTIDFLERARSAFGVHKPIDPELIRHWHRSRAAWLEFNPMLAIRMTTQRGSYFDTEPLVLSRVRAATAQLAMVSTFQAGDPDRPSYLFSSSRTNNWETLDIHHYIVLWDNPGHPGTLDGDCVPIHSRGSRVVELSDLSIEIDPNFRGRRATIAKIDSAVGEVYRGHLAHMFRRNRNARTRTYDRLFASLAYFLRSFHSGGRSWSAAVSLATAFEMVLTDSYSAGVGDRLVRRLALVLHGIVGKSDYVDALTALYEARSDLVHAGTDPTDLDLRTSQQAFVHAFAVVASRVRELPARTGSPMIELTRDFSATGTKGGEPARA